jgi:hypothetical protein
VSIQGGTARRGQGARSRAYPEGTDATSNAAIVDASLYDLPRRPPSGGLASRRRKRRLRTMHALVETTAWSFWCHGTYAKVHY